jgi:putative ABC transport system permease protein
LYLSATMVSEEYLDVMGLKMKQGRWFRSDDYSKEPQIRILNETAAKELGLNEDLPVKMFRGKDGYEIEVVGIVEDYHFENLFQTIGPLCLIAKNEHSSHLLVRVEPNSGNQIIQKFELFIRGQARDPYGYSYVSDLMEEQYRSDNKTQQLLFSFLILAMLLAVAGLISFTFSNSEKRSQELAIRKVLGANPVQLNGILVISVMKWILFAQIIAIPSAYYCLQNWLDRYAYKIDNDVWIYIIPVILVSLISITIILGHTIHVSRVNPIRFLRNE